MRVTTLLLVYHNYHFSDRLLGSVSFDESSGNRAGIDPIDNNATSTAYSNRQTFADPQTAQLRHTSLWRRLRGKDD